MTRDRRLTRRTALRSGAVAAGLLGASTGVGTARSAEHCYYQVDFVAGDSIETLGTDEEAFYGRQNRLIQYAHADGNRVIRRDTWIGSLDPEIRECVTADPIEVDDGDVSVSFTVAEGCEVTLTLAIYPLPGGDFSFIERQELAAVVGETFGPGTHELTFEEVLETVCPSPSIGTWVHDATLVADEVEDGDRFGWSVGVSDSGGTVVVGAPDDSTDVSTYGSVYVFDRVDGAWTREAILALDDLPINTNFGWSVAVSGAGETVVVGTYPINVRSSLPGAYVFDRGDDGWTRQAELVADDPGDTFGWSVAVSDSGETAVVGEVRSDTDVAGLAGAVYVFERVDGAWTQRAKLAADDARWEDEFGDSVAISDSGERVLVGSPNDGGYAGAAYVFERVDGAWTQRATLTVDEAERNEYSGESLGGSVAISGSGETAVVGSVEVGVYVFGRVDGTWTRQAKLPGSGDHGFGEAVAISDSGETIVAGYGYDPNSVYVFGRVDGIWTRQAKLPGAGGYGSSESVVVSGSGGTVVVGDPEAAYVFER